MSIEVTALGVAANGSAADLALAVVTARMVSARDDGAVVAARERLQVEVNSMQNILTAFAGR